MTYYLSDCCAAKAVYEIDEALDEAQWRCDACGGICEMRAVETDSYEIAYRKAERRGHDV